MTRLLTSNGTFDGLCVVGLWTVFMVCLYLL